MTDQPLSPTAQAIRYAAICAGPELEGRIAAALRAAADQIAPHISRTPWLTNDDGYFNETFENLEALGELNSSSQLLAIAAELEAQ
jgi:hypothetical protein